MSNDSYLILTALVKYSLCNDVIMIPYMLYMLLAQYTFSIAKNIYYRPDIFFYGTTYLQSDYSVTVTGSCKKISL